jgi:SAM-dependent methyltransferase
MRKHTRRWPKAKQGDKATARRAARASSGWLERLKDYRVLDPACGSGNFLYLALKCLKDIEHQQPPGSRRPGPGPPADVTGPHNVLGIELNEYAAELARVTVWIGELQWRIQHGYPFKTNPVLEPLDHIECRDAVLGSMAQVLPFNLGSQLSKARPRRPSSKLTRHWHASGCAYPTRTGAPTATYSNRGPTGLN